MFSAIFVEQIQIMELILKYFPGLSPKQQSQFELLFPLYKEWNAKINVISRKDINNLYLHHVLHSMAIARVIDFKPGTKVLDIGTGGGFPGIPLAILFPKVAFELIDSVGKKINVVNAVKDALELSNVKASKTRAEDISKEYDFVVSRAVSDLSRFVALALRNVSNRNINDLSNGILYLKGGDIHEEMKSVKQKYNFYPLGSVFNEDYFNEKFIVHIFRGESGVQK